jgi:YVTN family beta-propeller protein
MRTYRFARNVLVLLASTFVLASPGTAFGDEHNLLPVVINNVKVPIGDLTINYPPPFDLGVCCSPNGVVANPATNRIYSVEASGSGAFTPVTGWSVSAIDGNLTNHTWNQIIKNIPISNESNVGGQFLAVNTKTNKIYAGVALFSSADVPPPGQVIVIDGFTNKVIKKIEFASGLPEIAVNEATNKIYVTDAGPPTLYEVDGNTDTIIKTIPNAGYELSVSEKNNKVFLANYDAGTVSVVDGATDTVIASGISLSNCPVSNGYSSCTPIQTAVNDRTGKVYVVREGDGKLSVLDVKTYSEIATISYTAQGQGGYGIDIDREANLIYIANQDVAGIAVVDGDSNKYIGTVPVGLPPLNEGQVGTEYQPLMLSVDSQHHRLYVATGQSGAVAVLQTFGQDRHPWKESNAGEP